MPNGVQVWDLLRLEEGLIHSDVYTDQKIFDLEMERLFHGGWAYVGHESEIPNTGDYVLRTVGSQSVIMNRDDAGKLHILMNRCRHRANSVCQYDQGNCRQFECSYHGWVYNNDGKLISVPYKQGAYPSNFDMKDFGLDAATMGVYRGFIWANLSNSNTSLDEHLGPAAKKAIDLFCDASPEGEIILRQGCNKTKIYANWKFQGGDGYHTPVTHQANFGVMRGKRAGQKVSLSRGSMEDGWLSRDLGNGHSCLDSRSVGHGTKLPDTDWARYYRESMIKRRPNISRERIAALAAPRPRNWMSVMRFRSTAGS